MSFDGSGYEGAYVYKYDSELGALGYYHLYELTPFSDYLSPFDPRSYGSWSVNSSGRITGSLLSQPSYGMPPAVGRGGKLGGGKTGRKLNPDRANSWSRKIESLQKKLKNATTKTEKKEIQRQINHAREKLKASEPHGRKRQGS